jgi:hypothetical protein
MEAVLDYFSELSFWGWVGWIIVISTFIVDFMLTRKHDKEVKKLKEEIEVAKNETQFAEEECGGILHYLKKNITPWLEKKVVTFGDDEGNEEEEWSFANAVEGTQIFGATGSGKTSGSGQLIAKNFLYQKIGGLVLTAKPDETKLWKRYCEEMGRGKDLIIFSEGSKYQFNFLEYAYKIGGNATENIVSLFIEVTDAVNRHSSKNVSENANFWKDQMRSLLRNTIDLLKFSGETISIKNMNRLVSSATSEETKELEYYNELLGMAVENELSEAESEDFEGVIKYWGNEFPRIPEKTRNTVLAEFRGFVDMFTRSPFRELFSSDVGENEVTPDDSFKGKIIVLDFPVRGANKEMGRRIQLIFKHLWQFAAEGREVKEETLPVFLWADEAQEFIAENDMCFQSICRSARVCTVYLTQNIENYKAVLGGQMNHVNSLMGNFNTKIFHQNSETVTNRWASDLIGTHLVTKISKSTSTSTGESTSRGESSGESAPVDSHTPYDSRRNTNTGLNTGKSTSTTTTTSTNEHEVREKKVEAESFNLLKSGGAKDNYNVEFIAVRGGKEFIRDSVDQRTLWDWKQSTENLKIIQEFPDLSDEQASEIVRILKRGKREFSDVYNEFGVRLSILKSKNGGEFEKISADTDVAGRWKESENGLQPAAGSTSKRA